MTNERIEVLTSLRRRRRWSRAEKEKLVAASLEFIRANYVAGGANCSLGGRRASLRCGSRQTLRRLICLAPEPIEFASGDLPPATLFLDQSLLENSSLAALDHSGRWTGKSDEEIEIHRAGDCLHPVPRQTKGGV
jgi:hypothetical protein